MSDHDATHSMATPPDAPVARTHEELGPGRVGALAIALAEHPFTKGFDAPHIDVLASLASEVEFAAGGFVLRCGDVATALYLLTSGDVALEMVDAGRKPHVLTSLHPGDTFGWSWIQPPWRWHFDAVATTDAVAVALDADRLRAHVAADAAFGRDIMIRMNELVVDRLQHAHAQLASLELP